MIFSFSNLLFRFLFHYSSNYVVFFCHADFVFFLLTSLAVFALIVCTTKKYFQATNQAAEQKKLALTLSHFLIFIYDIIMKSAKKYLGFQKSIDNFKNESIVFSLQI